MSSSSPSASAAGPQWVGRVIDGRYKILEVLGEGGMGAVFVAEHLRLRKQVAFKTIRADFAAHKQAEARFNREALATGRLDHPHIASAIDFGPLPEGGFYLVTQLVRGDSLTSRLAAGPMPWPQVCLLGSQIADALAAAHAHGITHRDLKPDNILLEARRDNALHARVVDFGIARVSADEAGGTIADLAQPLTRTGTVIGTPGYMPPEQATGQPIDHRVDLYALGVILWEAFTGQILWQGDTLDELLGRQLSRPAPSLRGDVPEAMAVMIERLLAIMPADRPATALEVRDELRRLALGSELGVTASTDPADTPAGTISPATSGAAQPRPAPIPTPAFHTSQPTTLPTPAPAVAPVAPARSNPIVWLGGALAALAIILLAIYGAGDRDRTRRVPIAELVAEAPPAYAEDIKMLLGSRHLEARKLASDAIARAPDADRSKIPEYLRNLAEYERTRDCDARKAILARLDAADEFRALSPLQILVDLHGDTCDLRDELARLVTRFEAATHP